MGFYADKANERGVVQTEQIGMVQEGMNTQRMAGGFPGTAQAPTYPVTQAEVPSYLVPASEDVDAFDELCRKYKKTGAVGYAVTVNLSQDDDMDKQCNFLFKEPKPASYDRYVKTASVSSTKAMKTFVLDNIHEEQKRDLEAKLNDYPAMGISLGEKLLYMLGLSKTTTVKRL